MVRKTRALTTRSKTKKTREFPYSKHPAAEARGNTGIGRGRHPDAGRKFTDGDMETVSNIPFGVSVPIGVLR